MVQRATNSRQAGAEERDTRHARGVDAQALVGQGTLVVTLTVASSIVTGLWRVLFVRHFCGPSPEIVVSRERFCHRTRPYRAIKGCLALGARLARFSTKGTPCVTERCGVIWTRRAIQSLSAYLNEARRRFAPVSEHNFRIAPHLLRVSGNIRAFRAGHG